MLCQWTFQRMPIQERCNPVDIYWRKTFLFNDELNTFYLWLYDIGHMVEDHSYRERRKQLPPLYGLFFLSSSKESFIYIEMYLKECQIYNKF